MITFQITGTTELVARFEAMPDRVRSRVRERIQDETVALKLAALDRMAEMFRNGGGSMRYALSSDVEDSGTATTGTVTASGLPYLAIQEYGGVTKPHDIFPVNAKVLAFGMPAAAVFKTGSRAGDMVFAKVVHHPGSDMPERSYLRYALATRRAEIQAALLLTVSEASAGE